MIDFPKHECGLSLEHNEHKNYYEYISDYIESHDFNWHSEEQKQRAIENNEIWVLHWYPDTPIGCYSIAAPTLEELMLFSKEVT